MAGEIAAIVAEEGFQWLKKPIKRVATLDVPAPFCPPLETYIAPSAEKIAVAVKQLLA